MLNMVIIRLRRLMASRRVIACALVAVAPAVVGLAMSSWRLALVTSVTSLALLLIVALQTQHGRRVFAHVVTLNAAFETAKSRLENAGEDTGRAIQQVSSEMSEMKVFMEEARRQLADQWSLLNRLREDSLLSAEQADVRYAASLRVGDLDHLEEAMGRHSAQIVAQERVLDEIHNEIAQIQHRNYSWIDEQIVASQAAMDALRGRLVHLEARHTEETAALAAGHSAAFAAIQEEIANTRHHAALHSSSLVRLQAEDESLKRALEAGIQQYTRIAEDLTQLRQALPTADLNDDRYAAVAETLISISQRMDELDDKLVSHAAKNGGGAALR
jgi:chromosome segregation ATPase